MWQIAKDTVIKDNSDITPNSERFYKVAMSNYKTMNKLASAEETINSLFREGVISYAAKEKFESEKLRLEICAEVLEKQASSPFVDNLKSSLMAGGIAALTTGGILGAGKLVSSLHNKLNRQKKLKGIYAFNPTIREMDPKFVNQVMDDLENLNPEYAKSPMIAGKVIKDSNVNGGLGPDQANTLKDNDSKSLFNRVQDTAINKINDKLDYKPAKTNNKGLRELEKSLAKMIVKKPKDSEREETKAPKMPGSKPKSYPSFGQRMHDDKAEIRNTPTMFGQRMPKKAEGIFSAEELF